MILTADAINLYMTSGQIKIEGFRPELMNPNSVDVTLGDTLITYHNKVIDVKQEQTYTKWKIPEEGFLIVPGEIYLGVTEQKTDTPFHVPILEGISSLGRLGVTVHETAGFGDIGFNNCWTLEISCKRPTRIYKGMRIAQVAFFEVRGGNKMNFPCYKGKYTEISKEPVASKYHLNFKKDEGNK